MEFLSTGVAALMESSPDPMLQQFVGWLDQTQAPFYQALEVLAKRIDNGFDTKDIGYTDNVFTGRGLCTVVIPYQWFGIQTIFPEVKTSPKVIGLPGIWHNMQGLEINKTELLWDTTYGQVDQNFANKYLLLTLAETRNYYHVQKGPFDVSSEFTSELSFVHFEYSRRKETLSEQSYSGHRSMLRSLGVIE